MSNWKEDFLVEFAITGATNDTCQKLGIHRRSLYHALEHDMVFRGKWEEIRKQRLVLLEETAFERALVDKSDRMIIHLLKCLDPDTYGDRIELKGEFTHLLDMTLDGTTSNQGKNAGLAPTTEEDD